MNIAVIGTGNVGGALAQAWAKAGHTVRLGVRNPESYKGKEDLETAAAISAHSIPEAVAQSAVVLIAIYPQGTKELVETMGDVSQKVIIDAMNSLQTRPEPYNNTTEALLDWTNCKDVVKCFNTTGYVNMLDPVYNGEGVDMFMAGDSQKGKEVAMQLAKDAGFGNCYDVGGNDKFGLLEQLTALWISLAMTQNNWNIAFKLLKR
ncbi:NAD(P)-binding domain-containing protein [Nibrella viscosa]|uniref:NAD(P)-binding domain-containing protein n=1 Tax=Nibrella viscosa TaxID=1084524 RepID=A0ABP8KCQ0_9BACT